MPLRLFVYGTLKRGWWNHERFCVGHVELREAEVLGRLYQLPAGYPMLRVPDETVLGEGSGAARADLALQARMDRVLALHPDLGGPIALPQAWGPVRGELLTFDDPAERLRAIDRLEGFVAGGVSLYRRVLVPAVPEGAAGPVAAWAYVFPGGAGEGDVLERLAGYLPGGRWPVDGSGGTMG